MMELRKSDVVFDEVKHTYTRNGVRLSGVTAIVKWMYPETYKNIPESVLMKAAERGTRIHKECQMTDIGIPVDSMEAAAYRRLKAEKGLETLKNEWLVDDGAGIASSIDVVFTDYSLADIKGTSVIHDDCVTLQLSIYAYLLELMNPGLVVPALYVIWLPMERYGNPEMRQLKRIDADIVKDIITDYLSGADNTTSRNVLGIEASKMVAVSQDGDNLPAAFHEAERQVAELEMTMKRLKEQSERLRAGLLDMMMQNGVKKFEGDAITLTVKEAYTRSSIDTTKLKKEHPDIWEAYQKETKVKESLQIKIKDGKE